MRNADCGMNSAFSFRIPQSAFRISYSVFSGSSALDVMKLSKVALQLYTLRDFCGSAKDLATSLKKVKAIGYDGVEFVRSDFASNQDLRKLADANGLAISSIHEAGDRLLYHPQTA